MILDFAVLLGHLTYDHPSSQCQKMFFLEFNGLWCYGEEQTALWRRVVNLKYGTTWEIGALSRFGSQMVRVCGRISEDGTASHIFAYKPLVMVLKFSLGMICGMVRLLLR